MVVYISTFLIVMVLALGAKRLKKPNKLIRTSLKKKKRYIMKRDIFVFLIIVILTLISGLRYDVGTDYLHIYVREISRRIVNHDYVMGFEIGYRLAIELLLHVTKDYVWVFLISAFAINFLMVRSIYEYSLDPTYGIIVYLLGTHYLISNVYVRQYIGIAIFVYSIRYLEKKEYIKYLFLILLASSFHVSLVLCLPLVLINRLRIDRVKTIIISVIAILILSRGTSFVISLVSRTGYAGYLINAKYNTSNALLFWIVISGFQFAIMFIERRNRSKEDDKYNMYYNLQFITTMIAISSIFIPMVRRIIIIFACSSVISASYMTQYIKNRTYRRIVEFSYVVLLIFYSWYSIVLHGSGDLLPYTFIFNKGVQFY